MHNSNAYFCLAACQCRSLLKPVLLWGVLCVWHMDWLVLFQRAPCPIRVVFLVVVSSQYLSDSYIPEPAGVCVVLHERCVWSWPWLEEHCEQWAVLQMAWRCVFRFRMCMFIRMRPAFIACAYSRLSPRMRDSNRWNWFHTAGTSPGQSNYEL